MIINLDGELQLIDLSNKHPTRIKVDEARSFKLNYKDFFGVGASQLVQVTEVVENVPT